jgi:predicted metalloprotease with PDZ domain
MILGGCVLHSSCGKTRASKYPKGCSRYRQFSPICQQYKLSCGVKKNNYEALLANAGLLLQKAAPGKGWLGRIPGRPGNGGLVISGSTSSNSPAYKAGLDANDTILQIDGKDVKEAASINDIIKDKKPGDKVSVSYKNRTGNHEATITLEESPSVEVVTYEKAGKELSQQQKDFRSNWLSSKVK